MILPPALSSFMLVALKESYYCFHHKNTLTRFQHGSLPCGGRLECSLMRPAIDTIPNCIIIFPGPLTCW